MGVRTSVFGSKKERVHYEHLETVWGEEYCVYHNLPFLNVYAIDDKLFDWQACEDAFRKGQFSFEALRLSEIEKSRLKKTSIDYVFCEKDGRPLLCIDFDGLQEGNNRGLKYEPAVADPDLWRQQITDLKLRVANGSSNPIAVGVPYVVMSSKEFVRLDKEDNLTLADAVFGSFLAHREAQSVFDKGFTPELIGWNEEDFSRLSREEQDDQIQDWVIGVEVEAEAERCPVWQAQARVFNELVTLGYGHPTGCTQRCNCYPPIAEPATPIERGRAFDEAKRLSFTYQITTPFGQVEKAIDVPNFRTPGVPMFGDIGRIAEYLCFREYLRLARQDVLARGASEPED